MARDFVWRDAGRIVVFRRGAMALGAEALAGHGLAGYRLLSTARALAAAPELAASARSVHEVGPGQVPGLAAALLGDLEPAGGPGEAPLALVALGGGRVIDTAKAVAAVTGAPVVAIPTTLSGAEMTAVHRLPAGAEERVGARVRPALVLADPTAMTGQPEPALRASAMNALAHGADSLYTPLSNPVSEQAALRGAELIAAALDLGRAERDPAGLAFGSILCAYAIDSAGFGLHHVVCQSLVRQCDTPHAETNAAVLPHVLGLLAERLPGPFEPLATALGTDPDGLPSRVRELAGDPPGLAALGAERSQLDEAIEAMLTRPELHNVPTPPSHEDLARLLGAASPTHPLSNRAPSHV